MGHFDVSAWLGVAGFGVIVFVAFMVSWVGSYAFGCVLGRAARFLWRLLVPEVAP